MSLPAYVPPAWWHGVSATCSVGDESTWHVPESRDPDPVSGMYVGKLDALRTEFRFGAGSLAGRWHEKCLPLPCSRCGLTITHFHAPLSMRPAE